LRCFEFIESKAKTANATRKDARPIGGHQITMQPKAKTANPRYKGRRG
jgi:hypothetical protein